MPRKVDVVVMDDVKVTRARENQRARVEQARRGAEDAMAVDRLQEGLKAALIGELDAMVDENWARIWAGLRQSFLAHAEDTATLDDPKPFVFRVGFPVSIRPMGSEWTVEVASGFGFRRKMLRPAAAVQLPLPGMRETQS